MITTGKRLGVLGGTFDPPHVGHLVAAVNVRHSLRLDRCCSPSPTVRGRRSARGRSSPAVDRLAMVEAAVADVDGLEASDIELDGAATPSRSTRSTELLAEDPDRELFVIVGQDAAAGMPTWERIDDLRERAGSSWSSDPARPSPCPAGWEFDRVEVPRLEVSSTDLRARAVDGRPLDYLVPAGVISVLADRRLYRVACP